MIQSIKIAYFFCIFISLILNNAVARPRVELLDIELIDKINEKGEPDGLLIFAEKRIEKSFRSEIRKLYDLSENSARAGEQDNIRIQVKYQIKDFNFYAEVKIADSDQALSEVPAVNYSGSADSGLDKLIDGFAKETINSLILLPSVTLYERSKKRNQISLGLNLGMFNIFHQTDIVLQPDSILHTGHFTGLVSFSLEYKYTKLFATPIWAATSIEAMFGSKKFNIQNNSTKLDVDISAQTLLMMAGYEFNFGKILAVSPLTGLGFSRANTSLDFTSLNGVTVLDTQTNQEILVKEQDISAPLITIGGRVTIPYDSFLFDFTLRNDIFFYDQGILSGILRFSASVGMIF